MKNLAAHGRLVFTRNEDIKMIRLFGLGQWSKLGAGEIASFDNMKARTVRLEVILEAAGALYIHTGDDEGLVVPANGRETVEFYADGAFAVSADVGLAIFTADMDVRHIVNEGQVSFARVVERRARNPELEVIEQRMHENMRRMMQSQLVERERMIDRRVQAAIVAERAAAQRRESEARHVDGNAPPIDTGDAGKASGAAAGAAESGGTDVKA